MKRDIGLIGDAQNSDSLGRVPAGRTLRGPLFCSASFWIALFWTAVACGLLRAPLASAELQVTEVLLDPLTIGDKWEWIEVRNTGLSDVDLKDYYAARLDDAALAASAPPSIDANAQQTVVPAGGVAVLYAGRLGGAPNDFRDDLFRTAWGLSAETTVVGVNDFPALTNTGTAFGFWPTRADYDADLIDEEGSMRVGGFGNAAFSLDYRSDFPRPEGASIRWNGMGSNQDAANWLVSSVDDALSVTSTPLFTPGTTLGSPGIVPMGTAASGLLITEVMYNPVDAEPAWEWIEVLNNTGMDIDFASDNFVIDDSAGAALTGANITSGGIAQGEVAVLYNDALSPAQVQAAWDPGGVRAVNFVPVANFSALNNTSDTIGLWSSFAAYSSEAVTGTNRTTANAATALNYASGSSPLSGSWPSIIKGRSIYLEDLSADSALGDNWALSAEGMGDAFFIATANAIYAGGDVGDPGVFVTGPSGLPGDFDNDGDVDDEDLSVWERRLGEGATVTGGFEAWEEAFGTGQLINDGSQFLAIQRAFGEVVTGGEALNGDDFLEWQRAYDVPAVVALSTTVVPEPAAIALAILLLGARASCPGRGGTSFISA